MLDRLGLTTLATLALGGCQVVFPLEDGPTPSETFTPSNDVGLELLDGIDGAVSVGDTTIDVETGEITGVRGPGPGEIDGIGYTRLDGFAVFAFGSLEIRGRVRLAGDRPVVLLVGTDLTMTLTGVLDGSAGCAVLSDTRCGGPGGNDGHPNTAPLSPCDGLEGVRASPDTNDGGGGGGGGGTSGATAGGVGGVSGAAGGMRCSSTRPLRGGGGGGSGSAISSDRGAGGGGGGAIQITALGILRVDGSITVGGGGGLPGPTGSDAGGGGGGGGGGAILLEASTIELRETGILAANGGGGAGASSGLPGMAGQSGLIGDQPAKGGACPDTEDSPGGDGGALMLPTGSPSSILNNGGGAGGAAGVISIRSATPPLLNGVISPIPSISSLEL